MSRAQNPPLNTLAGNASKAMGPCRDGLPIQSRRKHSKQRAEMCVRHENEANSLPGSEITCICDRRNSQRLLYAVGHGAWSCAGDQGPAHMCSFLEMVEWEAGLLETVKRRA